MLGTGQLQSRSAQQLRAACSRPEARISSRVRSRGAPRISCKAAPAGSRGCKLVGVGSAVPAKVLTNNDMSAFVDTSDEWIRSRTGIRERRILGKDESLVGLATDASKKALEMANVAAKDVDCILFATSSPDDLFGSACQVQAGIGAKGAVAFDITAACSGFVVGLVTAAQYIRTGTYKNILVVGADALSRMLDWRDRGTCILFGDGCGAVLVSAGQEGEPCGLLGMDMHSDGNGSKHLHTRFSGKGLKPLEDSQARQEATYANIHMAGQEVFKFAVRSVPTVIEAALADAGMTKQQVNWLVMHQANQRIMDAAADRLGLPSERVISNLARYGNTSAASIPLALDEAVRGGSIKAGDVIAMAGFGAGLTWAGAIVRWM